MHFNGVLVNLCHQWQEHALLLGFCLAVTVQDGVRFKPLDKTFCAAGGVVFVAAPVISCLFALGS